MTSMKSSTSDLIVIGSGPAGMMCAVTSAQRGAKVLVMDPNGRVGKKLRITGKGRCNVTSDTEPRDFLQNICTNEKFFKSALYAFPPSAVKEFFEAAGVPLKTERGERVFPVSDNANDVADALDRMAREAGVDFSRERVRRLLIIDGAVQGVETDNGRYSGTAAAVCTGGLSYPATGSTGDGYALAGAAGHTVVTPRASLVPWEAEPDCARLQGLSLRNVGLKLYQGDKLLYRDQGEMLFTHFGVSGPLILTASTFLRAADPQPYIEIDLKPALTPEKLDERLLRDFAGNANKDFINALDELLPQKLIPLVVERSGIGERRKVNSITREERLRLRDLLKCFTIRLIRPRGVEEAIVTAGGVDVKEINPRTMESKLVHGLYFAGEVLDIDGRTGGFNLQIAWSTGRMAGKSVPLEEMI